MKDIIGGLSGGLQRNQEISRRIRTENGQATMADTVSNALDLIQSAGDTFTKGGAGSSHPGNI